MPEAASPFLERILAQLELHPGLAVIVAESAWGAPYLFEALSHRAAPCIWLKLAPEDEGDAVAQGNKLSDAVTRAFGSPLFGHGMAYGYGVAILKQHLGLLEPLVIALSNADYGQELALELSQLQRPGSRVALHFEASPSRFLIPDEALLLQADELKLSLDEALKLGAGRLGEVEARNLWRLSRGAYEGFLLQLHARLSLPPPLRPGPGSSELPPGSEGGVPPAILLQVLARRGQWLEALEVAAQHLPERVPELLAQAGDAYLERGLYRRLFQLLEPLAEDEAVLTWQLRAAKRLGRVEELRPRVERVLAQQEAPDLRASYAQTLPPPFALAEAERAYRAAKTPVTLQHYGFCLMYEDPQASLMLFRELFELANRLQSPAKQVLATMMMHPPLILMGRYQEAAYTLEEALSRFDQHGLGDWQARMHIVHNWAYTRILIGETVGLAEILQKEARALRDAYPLLALSFRSVLGDYLLSQGRPREALPYYQENLDALAGYPHQGRDLPPNFQRDLVHCLLHLRDFERAGYLAYRHYQTSRAAPEPQRSFAILGHGMVLALQNPAEAVALLEAACESLARSFSGDHLASATLYLARAHLALGEAERAAAVLKRSERALAELSDTGFRLLAGPEDDFREVYRLWRGRDIPLQLRFLGGGRASLDGRALELFPQWQEVLALLAMHPDGLGNEQLLLELFGDGGNPATLKASISKLRRKLPVTRAPYRLGVPCRADFLELEQLLREGRVRAGLELYQGPLLPRSQAPGVVRLRETLEESLRRAVLTSGDPEALLSLSERLGDDLELWEAAISALPRQDPRHSLASAKHKRVLESW